MKKRNHFSDKFESKLSDELRNVIDSEGYQQEAKLAAAWELEKRGEATEEDLKLANGLTAEKEKKIASQLTGERYDTFTLRLVAAIIDGIALWVVGAILVYATSLSVGSIAIIGGVLKEFLPYVYSVLLHGQYGQTLGKMAMDVKVVSFEGEDDINFKQALIRDSIPIALMLILYSYSFILLADIEQIDLATDLSSLVPIFFIGILSFLWTLLEIVSMLFSEKNRAAHDLLAGTVVVRTN